MELLTDILQKGGPAIWAIAALSVITLALILWKTWRLMALGAWAGQRARRAVTLWQAGERDAARGALTGRVGLRARLVQAAMGALSGTLSAQAAQAETTRVAQDVLIEARSGLRALELIVAIAPLLGLLGTVMGMIEAFQTLEASGARANPADLAGGIWEALLTTAAGMGVAIPASMALSWFESIIDRARHDMEDLATRLFVASGVL